MATPPKERNVWPATVTPSLPSPRFNQREETQQSSTPIDNGDNTTLDPDQKLLPSPPSSPPRSPETRPPSSLSSVDDDQDQPRTPTDTEKDNLNFMFDRMNKKYGIHQGFNNYIPPRIRHQEDERVKIESKLHITQFPTHRNGVKIDKLSRMLNAKFPAGGYKVRLSRDVFTIRAPEEVSDAELLSCC